MKDTIIDQPRIDTIIQDVRRKLKSMGNQNRAAYIKKIITFLDLTTLSSDDTSDRIENLISRALNPVPNLPEISCAAICVYPARLLDVNRYFENHPGARQKLQIASVAAGFPSGQYRIESKLLEIKLAIEDGASEIDIVINRSDALMGHWETVKNEISQMKATCGNVIKMKTILATGELKSIENIYKASKLAMEAGSDFIKTSTGKEIINATLESSAIMCIAIKDFYQETKKRVGFKPAGGIKTTEQALEYTILVELVLGSDWLHPNLFRIGASSLLDELVKSLEIL